MRLATHLHLEILTASGQCRNGGMTGGPLRLVQGIAQPESALPDCCQCDRTITLRQRSMLASARWSATLRQLSPSPHAMPPLAEIQSPAWLRLRAERRYAPWCANPKGKVGMNRPTCPTCDSKPIAAFFKPRFSCPSCGTVLSSDLRLVSLIESCAGALLWFLLAAAIKNVDPFSHWPFGLVLLLIVPPAALVHWAVLCRFLTLRTV